MKEYTCIIVDDEPKAIDLLVDIIKELFTNIRVEASYTNWKEAVVALKRQTFDLLFLDISMPEKSGFDLLSFVPHVKSEIIFVTAHSEYAIDAFDYHTAGYVLKPVEELSINKAITKAIERINDNTSNSRRLAVPVQKGLNYIDRDKVIYLEAMAKHTKIKTTYGEILSSQLFGEFRGLLNTQNFYQTHRSFIVNTDHISRYETYGVVMMDDSSSIPVSKSFRNEFLMRFGKLI